ncbi:MAG TPA: hypothetical protein VMZ91_08965 [Candidatus Paceibacterota bacterium]|nr:hypothetical protein [Candidatus Paceibacterota bacterium]
MGKRTGTRTYPDHKFIKRPCKTCGEIFEPTSVYNWVCKDCLKKSIDLRNAKKREKIKNEKKENTNR